MHLRLHRLRDLDRAPFARRTTAPDLRVIFGCVALSILTLASACDKRSADRPVAHLTSLAGKPRMLLLLFGDKGDPRVLPLATLAGGHVTPITLDSAGWHNFDRTYFPAGATLSLYQDGKPIGDAVVRRGMWQGNDALYKLPKCRSPRPLAAVTLSASPTSAVMLELLATSDPLPPPPARTEPTAADRDSAHVVLARIAQHEGLTNSARGELDEVVSALPTGATSHPTLVGSYMERGSGMGGKARHVLAIADWVDASNSYVQSFVHVPGDSIPEFRRLIDHADLTGDGVDEIVLEGWHTGGDSYLIFLQFHSGHWREIARGATSWCGDPGKI